MSFRNILQSPYNAPHYNMDLDRTWSCSGSQTFLLLKFYIYYGILQRNSRKMTIKWSFSYNSFVKLSLYIKKKNSFITGSISMDTKHSVKVIKLYSC